MAVLLRRSTRYVTYDRHDLVDRNPVNRQLLMLATRLK
jgi:hypothetical protein